MEQILNDYPQIEAVQLQFNYVDYDDPAFESRKCYDVCVKYGKPVIVMEPVKGGSLATLPTAANDIIKQLGGGSPASYAIRFASSFDNIAMVLSGMSNIDQMKDNVSFMREMIPLSEKEHAAVRRICDIFHGLNLIACTACHYCTDGCPSKIHIPELFACMNARTQYGDWNSEYYYENVATTNSGKAKDCIECGACELSCPQQLPIRELLKQVAAEFENGNK